MHPDAFDFGATPQLFIEDDLIADAVGLQRRVHPLVKVSEAPVVPRTAAWEGQQMSPLAVVFDRPAGAWRLWYSTWGAREPQLPGLGMESLHLATSPDGLHWDKPALGAYAAAEAPGNNLCVFEDGTPVPGGLTYREGHLIM
ncbi:MAG TPA: hypothetical protein PLZ36_16915, partial [Armatimonadota bacterium]|nr:hypothetical protein [Armatimonadota bacterium]